MTQRNQTGRPPHADTAAHAGRWRWPTDVRIKLARAVVEEHLSSSEVAKQLGVPYTTALEWVKRYRAGGAAALAPATTAIGAKRSPRAEARRAAIIATKAAHPQAGHRRIRDVMQRFLGIGTSATTVLRVLKAAGSSVPRPQLKARARPRGQQRFERAEPNQLWQSDLFTFLLRRHERLYLVGFLDDHSRYLVSWALAHHQRGTLVLEALARGIAEYGAPREILTDQGRQYTAWRFLTKNCIVTRPSPRTRTQRAQLRRAPFASALAVTEMNTKRSLTRSG